MRAFNRSLLSLGSMLSPLMLSGSGYGPRNSVPSGYRTIHRLNRSRHWKPARDYTHARAISPFPDGGEQARRRRQMLSAQLTASNGLECSAEFSAAQETIQAVSRKIKRTPQWGAVLTAYSERRDALQTNLAAL